MATMQPVNATWQLVRNVIKPVRTTPTLGPVVAQSGGASIIGATISVSNNLISCCSVVLTLPGITPVGNYEVALTWDGTALPWLVATVP
jgi:hypothetical protein